MIRVNDIFRSIQGEGIHAGIPAVFIRLAGCNLSCEWCDTDHKHGKPMHEGEVIDVATQYWGRRERGICVVTGGEPLAQDIAKLCRFLRIARFRVHIETNGTRLVRAEHDWLTVSPKGKLSVFAGDELKLVWPQDAFSERDLITFRGLNFRHHILQPNSSVRQSAQMCYETVMSHEGWRLGPRLQIECNCQ